MVLRKSVEDGFTHFYRKCGQRSAQPLSTRDCHLRSFHNFAQWLNLALLPINNQHFWANALVRIPLNICDFNCTDSIVKVVKKVINFTNTGNATHQLKKSQLVYNAYLQWQSSRLMLWLLECTPKPLAATILIIQHIHGWGTTQRREWILDELRKRFCTISATDS